MNKYISNNLTRKSWWRPVWSGLVIDPEGKHSKQMGQSIWLFLFLLLEADYKEGTLVKSIKEISREMGRPAGTIKKWLKILKEHGYIQTQRADHSQFIHIRTYKDCDRANKSQRIDQNSSLKRSQSDPSARGQKQPRTPYFNSKFAKVSDILDRIDKDKYINIDNIDREINSFKNQKEKFIPRNKEGLLALDIARGLGDLKGIKYYFSVCKKNPELVIRRIYSQVKELPEEKVKNKGALFNHLIQKLCANQNDLKEF